MYYHKPIPNHLIAPLTDAGMKLETEDFSVEEHPDCPDIHCLTTYGEVLDFLADKGLLVGIFPTKPEESTVVVWAYRLLDTKKPQYRKVSFVGGWEEATDAAIVAALKML